MDILNTNDRNLAILVGRALESQELFHHVNYECKLRDLDELYRFQYKHHDDDPTFNYAQRPPIHPTTPTKSKKGKIIIK